MTSLDSRLILRPADDFLPPLTGLGAQVTPGFDNTVGRAAALADEGQLKAYAGAAKRPFLGRSGSGSFGFVEDTRFVIDDLMFSLTAVPSPPPFPGSATASLNLGFSGDIRIFMSGLQVANTQVRLFGRVGSAPGASDLIRFQAIDTIRRETDLLGPPFLDDQRYVRENIDGVFYPGVERRLIIDGRDTRPLNEPFPGGEPLFHLLDQLPGDLLTTSSFDVPLGEPLEFELRLALFAQLSGGGFGALEVDFSDTVGFPTSGPVFNLPPGITVNSVSGHIVDNRFVGGTRASVIPEPSSLALLGIGTMSLLAAGWRRRRRCSKVRV